MSHDRKTKSLSRASPGRPLSSPSTVYRFRLSNISTFGTSAGTVIASVITCDPSSFTEFSDLSNLFSEIRIVSSKIHLANRPVLATDINADHSPALPVGFDPGITSTVPTTQVAVWAIGGARQHPLNSLESHTYVAKIPNMAWATTASPVPGAYAGCYGAWQLYQAGFTSGSVVMGLVYTENVYELRGRR
jgi:hypothetical protein